MKIDNWCLVGTPDPYQAPETIKVKLYGAVYGHPDFMDGTFVTTSSIQKVEDNKIFTRNSVYELGEVNEDYEKHYPGARDRLFNGAVA